MILCEASTFTKKTNNADLEGIGRSEWKKKKKTKIDCTQEPPTKTRKGLSGSRDQIMFNSPTVEYLLPTMSVFLPLYVTVCLSFYFVYISVLVGLYLVIRACVGVCTHYIIYSI